MLFRSSVLKEAIKRRNPGFNENYYGFRTFGNLLEDASKRGLIAFGRDEKSGTYVFRGTGEPMPASAQGDAQDLAPESLEQHTDAPRRRQAAHQAAPLDGQEGAEVLAAEDGIEPDTEVADGQDRKSTRLNSSHSQQSRMPSSA